MLSASSSLRLWRRGFAGLPAGDGTHDSAVRLQRAGLARGTAAGGETPARIGRGGWTLFGFVGTAALVAGVASQLSTYLADQAESSGGDPLHPSVLSPPTIAGVSAGLSVLPALFAGWLGPRAVAAARRQGTASWRVGARVALTTQLLSTLGYTAGVVALSMRSMQAGSPALTEKMRAELAHRFGNHNPLAEELQRIRATLSPPEQTKELVALAARLWLLSTAVTLIATWWLPFVSVPAVSLFAAIARR